MLIKRDGTLFSLSSFTPIMMTNSIVKERNEEEKKTASRDNGKMCHQKSLSK
jgi:hypothetical protein